MILTDREIEVALETRSIIVEPAPQQIQFSSTSLDLTLDRIITIFNDPKPGLSLTIDPSAKGFNHEEVLSTIGTQHDIEPSGYDFQPKSMILAWTTEYVALPSNSRLAARVEGKSSLARLGISVHITAPTIHAGFEGQVRLEMYNYNLHPIRLSSGMRVCQLIFEQTLGTPVRGYSGRFARQKAATQNG